MNTALKIITVLLSTLGVLFIGAVIFVLYTIRNVDNKYTGEQLFTVVNEHRQSIGVAVLELDANLCDNLIERWLAIREPNAGHNGFEEWAEGEGLTKDGITTAPYSSQVGITELFIQDSTTPEWALQAWMGSPGHRVILESPSYNVGCSYAHDGDGVVILSQKN